MSVETQQFTGTDQYIATDSLKLAVKAARSLQKPLLVKGEPGTGNTLLAEQVAESLGLKLLTWNIKSTTKAQQACNFHLIFYTDYEHIEQWTKTRWEHIFFKSHGGRSL